MAQNIKAETNLDTPQFAIPGEYLIGVNDYPSGMMEIPPSRMFVISAALKKYRENAGEDAPIYDASQGDGGKSLPGTPRVILERALELQINQGTAYDQPWGTPLFRKASSELYWKFDAESGWGPANIAFTQGGRDGLIKAYQAMISLGNGRVGDALVVSRVPWISYNWGPYGVGLNVLLAPGQPEVGWQHTPEGIKASVEYAARAGRKVAGLVITSPDNPTGRTLTVEEQILLARTAIECGYPFVLFDWMYHWVTDSGPTDINQVLKAFSAEERKKLMFIDGITKSLGASNIRSAQIVADKTVIDFITSQASHGVIPSFFAQAVTIAAYEMGFEKAAESIIKPTSESRRILRSVLEQAGQNFIMGDGYYAFIDCGRYIDAGGFQDSSDLGAWLGEQFGVTIVPGAYFSDAGANWVRFSYALQPEKTEPAITRLLEGLNSLL